MSQRKSNFKKFKIEIKQINEKTKEIFYKNLSVEDQENLADTYHNDFILNELESFTSNLGGLNLKTLHKVKKKIENNIYFIPPNPIKRPFNSKEEHEVERAKKSKNVFYIKYLKQMNILLNESVKDEEYNPLVPNDFESILSEINAKKKALKHKKKVQKELIKKNLAALDLITNGTKSINKKIDKDNTPNCVSQLIGQYGQNDNYNSCWKNPLNNNQFFKIKKEEELHNNTGLINNEEFSTNFFCPNFVISWNSNEDQEKEHQGHDSNKQKKLGIKKEFIGRYLMEKMGWKGAGLGKYEQGIINPLFVKKTGTKYGKIINANNPEDRRKALNNENDILNSCKKLPTKILMLTNILTPDMIDQESIDEIRGECENYGTVLDMKIYNFCNPDLPVGEDIRVFLEYDSVESSKFAYQNLNERYFSGRMIRVKFYDEEMFYSDNLDSFNII